MPIPLWLVAAGVGALFVAANWDKVVDWLRDLTRRIVDAFRGGIGNAAKLFAQKIVRGVFKLIHVLFYKEGPQWVKETTRAEVDESEVPEWAKRGVGANETDVTDTYRRELSLEI